MKVNSFVRTRGGSFSLHLLAALLLGMAIQSCEKEEFATPGGYPLKGAVFVNPEATVYWGPQAFTRGTGTPVAETVTIDGADLINFEGCLNLMVRILPERSNQLANAVIRIDGDEVVVPGDFRRGADLIRKDICDKTGDFTLEVELRGNPGSGLEVWIEGIMKNPVTDPRDGTLYPWIQYGNQKWMVKNLAWLPSVTSPINNSRTDPYFYVNGYFGDDVAEAKTTAYYQTYGALYNIAAALAGCPPGWYLPGSDEWVELANYLVSQGFNFDGTYTGYKITKAMASKDYWDPSDVPGSPGFEPETNNGAGFSLLPGGYASPAGLFEGVGNRGYWWTSTRDSDWYYNIRRVTCAGTTLSLGTYGYTGAGWSVRCIRD